MAKITVLTDLSYDDSHERCSLDIFKPAGCDDAPLVILIHGGGWQNGRRQQYHGTCMRLAAAGFAAATVGYRLMPEVHWPDIAYDPLRASAFLRAHAGELGFDGTRAATWGSSAGGHLSLCLQARASEWAAAGASGPVPQIVATVAQCPATYFHEEKLSEHTERLLAGHAVEEASPFHMDPQLFASVLVAHGDKDELIPLESSERFVARLQAAGRDARLEVISGASHGYGYQIENPHAEACMALALPYLTEKLVRR